MAQGEGCSADDSCWLDAGFTCEQCCSTGANAQGAACWVGEFTPERCCRGRPPSGLGGPTEAADAARESHRAAAALYDRGKLQEAIHSLREAAQVAPGAVAFS